MISTGHVRLPLFFCPSSRLVKVNGLVMNIIIYNQKQRTTEHGNWESNRQGLSNTDGVSLDATSHKSQTACDAEMSLIEEMRKLREENSHGHKQTAQTLGRLEKVVTDIKEQLCDHQQRICELEGRVSEAENTEARQHCVLRYLLQRDKQLKAVCDDLQNRLRRNNLRIFQIPEGCEQRDVGAFVKDVAQSVETTT